MLAASLEAAGVGSVATARGADDLAGLVARLGDMAAQADLVITTGGVSVGQEDHVKPALAALAGETLSSGVAIEPGKPVSVGRIGKGHWPGLPGNPQSAYLSPTEFLMKTTAPALETLAVSTLSLGIENKPEDSRSNRP